MYRIRIDLDIILKKQHYKSISECQILGAKFSWLWIFLVSELGLFNSVKQCPIGFQTDNTICGALVWAKHAVQGGLWCRLVFGTFVRMALQQSSHQKLQFTFLAALLFYPPPISLLNQNNSVFVGNQEKTQELFPKKRNVFYGDLNVYYSKFWTGLTYPGWKHVKEHVLGLDFKNLFWNP